MTLSSSHLFGFSAVHRHAPAISTTVNILPWNKPTTKENRVRFLYYPSPILQRSLRLGENVVAKFAVPVDLIHDAGATIGVLGGAYALVFTFDDLTKRNILNQVSFLSSSLIFNCMHLWMNTIPNKWIKWINFSLICFNWNFRFFFIDWNFCVFENWWYMTLQGLSRKLVHILSGLLFLVAWPIFRYPVCCSVFGILYEEGLRHWLVCFV